MLGSKHCILCSASLPSSNLLSKSSKAKLQVCAQQPLLFLQMFRLRAVLWSTGSVWALFALVCCYSLLIV